MDEVENHEAKFSNIYTKIQNVTTLLNKVDSGIENLAGKLERDESRSKSSNNATRTDCERPDQTDPASKLRAPKAAGTASSSRSAPVIAAPRAPSLLRPPAAGRCLVRRVRLVQNDPDQDQKQQQAAAAADSRRAQQLRARLEDKSRQLATIARSRLPTPTRYFGWGGGAPIRRARASIPKPKPYDRKTPPQLSSASCRPPKEPSVSSHLDAASTRQASVDSLGGGEHPDASKSRQQSEERVTGGSSSEATTSSSDASQPLDVARAALRRHLLLMMRRKREARAGKSESSATPPETTLTDENSSASVTTSGSVPINSSPLRLSDSDDISLSGATDNSPPSDPVEDSPSPSNQDPASPEDVTALESSRDAASLALVPESETGIQRDPNSSTSVVLVYVDSSSPDSIGDSRLRSSSLDGDAESRVTKATAKRLPLRQLEKLERAERDMRACLRQLDIDKIPRTSIGATHAFKPLATAARFLMRNRHRPPPSPRTSSVVRRWMRDAVTCVVVCACALRLVL